MTRAVEVVAPARFGIGFRWLLGSSWISNLGDGMALAAGPLQGGRSIGTGWRITAPVALSSKLRAARHRCSGTERGGSTPIDVAAIDQHVPKRIRPAWRVVRRTVTNYLDEEGLQWSGAVAFYLVLSVPPLLIAAVSIGVVLVGADRAETFLVDQVAQFLPTEEDVIPEIVGQTVDQSGAAALFAIGFLLFSGSRIFASLIAAINIMWHEVEPEAFWRRQLQRVGMVLSIGVLLALAGIVDVLVVIASELFELPAGVQLVAQAQLVPALFLGSALFLLFYLVPRRAATWRTALAGAVVAAVLLRTAQAIFTAYLRTFGGFDSAYGPLASLAIILTWALVASGVILLAAHFVAVLNSPDREPRRTDHQLPGQPEASRRPKPKRREESESSEA